MSGSFDPRAERRQEPLLGLLFVTLLARGLLNPRRRPAMSQSKGFGNTSSLYSPKFGQNARTHHSPSANCEPPSHHPQHFSLNLAKFLSNCLKHVQSNSPPQPVECYTYLCFSPSNRFRTPLCDRECDWEAPISPYLASKPRWESSTASF